MDEKVILVNLLGLAVFSVNAGYFYSSIPSYSIEVAIFIAGAAVYLHVSKRTPFTGLSKKLMNIWVCILVFDILIPYLTRILSKFLEIQVVDTFSVVLLSLAFGMLCTYIFTSYRFPAVLSLVYTIIAVFFWQCASAMPYSVSFKMPYISIFIIPMAFLLLGGYLELRGGRGISA